MPVSKNQTARYYIIDECLTSRVKRFWSKRALLERINDNIDFPIEERTLDYDIQNLRQNEQLKYYAPIKYSKREDGYYYEDPDYSIRNLSLTDADINALEFAASTLGQYKDISILHDFTGAVDKVLNVVRMIRRQKSGIDFHFLDFEKAPYCKGNDFLDNLVMAINNEQVLEITHKKFTDSIEKKYIIHPYLLKEFRNRWYLLGYSEQRQDIITLGLDRMIRITEYTKKYIQPNDFNPERYFKNTIGITYSNKQVEKVILSFTPSQGEYIKTQHIHESQQVLNDDNTELRIQLDIIPNYEFYERILGYGSNVKVISPDTVRDNVIELLHQALSHYSK